MSDMTTAREREDEVIHNAARGLPEHHKLLYIEAPTPGTRRYVFVDGTVLNAREAETMLGKIQLGCYCGPHCGNCSKR